MNKLSATTIAASFAIFSTSFAFAQAPAEPGKNEKRGERAAQMQERLKAADKNGDGKISREEATASLPKLSKHFDQIDANKDGFISKDEMKAWHDKRGEHKAPPKS